MLFLASLIVLLLIYNSTASATQATSTSASAVSEKCGTIISRVGEGTKFRPSHVFECLQSIPFNVSKSMAFLDYIVPSIDMQSTLAYLKDPPLGYMLPAVDIEGGINQAREHILSGKFKNQYEFESEMHWLLNVAPHDGHLVVPLPLVRAFGFGLDIEVVSVSKDGDLLAKHESSPITRIGEEFASDYIQRMSQWLSFHDPDALYNAMFCSLPLTGNCHGQLGLSFSKGLIPDKETIQFQNGSRKEVNNIAVLHDRTRIACLSSGQGTEAIPDTNSTHFQNDSLTNVVFNDLKLSSDGDDEVSEHDGHVAAFELLLHPFQFEDRITRFAKVESQPILLHSQRYLAGYFLEDLETAVLVMSSFGGQETSIQEAQRLIEEFLARCQQENKRKLIIDLRDNGGGSVFAGYDAFKQLFPTLTPYGASRYRFTPFVDFVGSVVSASELEIGLFSVKDELKEDLQYFQNWDQVGDPKMIHRDKFTSILRWNLDSTPKGSGITVSGYGNRTKLPRQVFAAEDMIMLHNGYCASMCAEFSEFMRAQGGVRSISLGGRPQVGPMQGIGATKGSQVLRFSEVTRIGKLLPIMIGVAEGKGRQENIRALPPKELMPSPAVSFDGISARKMMFNFRNSYRAKDDTQTPLQFVYEASNCRLFYKQEDLFSAIPLWERVRDTAWREGTCVDNSTINTDNSIGKKAKDTLPFRLQFQ